MNGGFPSVQNPSRPYPPRPATTWLSHLKFALERRGASLFSLGVIAVVGAMGDSQVGPNGLWVLLLLVVVGYEFQRRIDQGLPLMQIAALLAVLQWLVGPVLAFGSELTFGRYIMYVDAPTYFSYALPGTAAFVLGILAVGSSVRQRALFQFLTRDRFVKIGIVLNLVAWAARGGVGTSFGIPSFLLNLLSQVGYVGALYFLFSRSRFRWPLIAISVYPLFSSSAQAAVFHNMLLWSALLFCYWYGMRRRTGLNKALLLTGGVMVVFTIQAIKPDYRARVWSGQEASLVEAVWEFWTNRGSVTRDEVIVGQIVRLNQGWIISAVMNHVPAVEPFAGGETIMDALVASLFPRFMMPDKARAGGQENFRRFTGLPIGDATSMSISPLGEGYANYGRAGGILAMLGFGLTLSGLYVLCLRRVLRHPDFLFWIPLIFYQALKAETEFATVWNQMTKGAIIAFGLHWLLVKHVMPLVFPRAQHASPSHAPPERRATPVTQRSAPSPERHAS